MAMGEGTDDDPLWITFRPQDYGFATSVGSFLQRIGERLADEPVWVGEHISNRGRL